MNITQPRFTGRHMTAVMVGFFGIVVAVNIHMARLASGTFGGTVVDNSYVASQKFNRWLAEARAADRLGWVTPVALDAGRRVTVSVPGPGFAVSGSAHHPLGRAPDIRLGFRPDGSGHLVATTALPPGRWQVRLTLRRGSQMKRLAEVLA